MTDINNTLDPEIRSIIDSYAEDPFEECHYQRLSYEGRSNIYSLAIPDYNFGALRFDEPLPKLSILAALSDGVYVLQENNDKWTTLTEPVDNGDEFTSLDAYYPGTLKDGSFLICYSKTNVSHNSFSINFARLAICSQSSDDSSNFIKVVDRFNISIPWVPLKITHVNSIDALENRVSFIVCSSSQSIHVFTEVTGKALEFKEVPLAELYPDLLPLSEVKSNILALTIQTEENTRFVAAGCQDGTLICLENKYQGDSLDSVKYEAQLYHPITSLVLFNQSEFTENKSDKALLATCAVNSAIVFKDLTLKNPIYLSIPCDGDSVLSATLADVNLDGQQEIILGTYDQQLLIYSCDEFKSFVLTSQRKFPYPIYGILNCDFDADGLKELIILTMYGIHVLKPRLSIARDRVLTYLQYIKDHCDISS